MLFSTFFSLKKKNLKNFSRNFTWLARTQGRASRVCSFEDGSLKSRIFLLKILQKFLTFRRPKLKSSAFSVTVNFGWIFSFSVYFGIYLFVPKKKYDHMCVGEHPYRSASTPLTEP